MVQPKTRRLATEKYTDDTVAALIAAAGGINNPLVASILTTDGPSKTALSNTYLSYIQAAKNPDLLVVGAITGDPMTSAAVVWPDGKPGVLTITARHSTGAVNAYNITHVDGATTKTYTQPAITRSTSGAPTNVPQIVVS